MKTAQTWSATTTGGRGAARGLLDHHPHVPQSVDLRPPVALPPPTVLLDDPL